jgi:transcriptional regulator with XRE-family HTH domain
MMVSSGARILSNARRVSGLSQRELATQARTQQSVVARTESCARDVTCETLDRLLRPTGYRLTAIPTRSWTAAEAADAIRGHLRAGNEDGAYRDVIQFNDDLACEHGALRVAIVVAPPGRTGDDRFDAILAALVEFRLNRERLPWPTWTAGHSLVERWFVDANSIDDPATVHATPEPFKRRGVIIDAVELVSV